MHPLDFAALVLASGGVVDLWFNGSIFAGGRAAMEARAILDEDATLALPFHRRFAARVGGFYSELFGCSYCANFHAPFVLFALAYLPSLWLQHPWDVAWKGPLYALAAGYAAWLANGARGDHGYDRGRAVAIRGESEERP